MAPALVDFTCRDNFLDLLSDIGEFVGQEIIQLIQILDKDIPQMGGISSVGLENLFIRLSEFLRYKLIQIDVNTKDVEIISNVVKKNGNKEGFSNMQDFVGLCWNHRGFNISHVYPQAEYHPRNCGPIHRDDNGEIIEDDFICDFLSIKFLPIAEEDVSKNNLIEEE
jgi:hypothetical protein